MGCLPFRVSIFFVSFCWLIILAVAQTTHPSEVNALLAVKKSLIDPMKNLKKWNKGDPCTTNWTGVLCTSTISNDGYLHVQKLHLLNMNLSGTLAPELGQLSQLQILDFMWNELTGTIPKEIFNMAPLRLLLLSGNKLSGSLPEEFGVLSYLNRIQIDENNISGPLPKSIGKMSRIKHLHFNNNSLSGPIPLELSNASTLLHMLFDNNNLSGHLPPELSKLSNLRIMQFDNNHFEGNEIPFSYGNFSKLVKLSLRNCRLQGAIPDLSQIPNLSYLDLSFNQLSGSIPSNTFSHNMTTIDLSSNHLNGPIPESFSDLPLLQRLSLWNNTLSGSIPANIWQNKSFSKDARIRVDLRNNSFSIIEGDLNIPQNVTLRLQGNPICNNANIRNIGRFCGSQAGGDETPEVTRNSTTICPIQACPVHNHFEYVPASPVSCYCASPLRVGFRLKSPSFSYFPPYEYSFDVTLTSSLSLDVYQLVIDSYAWEEGPRLRMDLKVFPMFSYEYTSTFNKSEIERLKGRLSSWDFRPSSDFFGPYELLNFTLLWPYADSYSKSETKNIDKGVLAGILVGAIFGAITFSAIIASLIARRRAKNQQNISRRRSSSKISMKIDGVKSFTFKEMALATDNFNCLTQVGRGGYGKVFKGVLANNLVVAVKRAEEGSLQGQKEFLTEIEMLSRLHHRNLVALIGYCDEEEEQMLVYEFMSNGTLRDWISDKNDRNLSFGMRLRIALGSAKGILYLHTEATPPIFHRDIKATNILLDSKLTAKVADFGLSRLAPMLDDEGTVPNHVSTVVKGTPGYLDPEYFLTRKLTDKSDVYSLGVVLLELLTGMHPIYHGKNIVREVNIASESGMIFSIIDSKMGTYPSECVERFVALAISCCHEKTEERPSMLDVVRELENILKMMPETGTSTSISEIATPEFSGQSLTSPSSNASRNYMFNSSEFSGSDLVSGVTPMIRPR